MYTDQTTSKILTSYTQMTLYCSLNPSKSGNSKALPKIPPVEAEPPSPFNGAAHPPHPSPPPTHSALEQSSYPKRGSSQTPGSHRSSPPRDCCGFIPPPPSPPIPTAPSISPHHGHIHTHTACSTRTPALTSCPAKLNAAPGLGARERAGKVDSPRPYRDLPVRDCVPRTQQKRLSVPTLGRYLLAARSASMRAS
ncbi:hypothetical protein BS50DRAFT_51105 [Corynespora cassiicola Philippines]|uniref:Uncharacterized protein n=1 Tax=Corynespora cassiicola Philippines TaxID=1448308 RepID=A0A2T2NJ81_CORCC|nr:hypothetical protein BS50DRAFT_51105 [Corynespora cassiicola Philippines]